MKDGQLVELINTHLVIKSALDAELDVARPERDDGIDLIIYRRKGGNWVSAPVQVKSRFAIEKKYLKRDRLVMAYVCGDKPDDLFVLTHKKAVQIAEDLGYTKSLAWKKGELNDDPLTGRCAYSVVPGPKLREKLKKFCASSTRWQDVLHGR